MPAPKGNTYSKNRKSNGRGNHVIGTRVRAGFLAGLKLHLENTDQSLAQFFAEWIKEDKAVCFRMMALFEPKNVKVEGDLNVRTLGEFLAEQGRIYEHEARTISPEDVEEKPRGGAPRLVSSREPG